MSHESTKLYKNVLKPIVYESKTDKAKMPANESVNVNKLWSTHTTGYYTALKASDPEGDMV